MRSATHFCLLCPPEDENHSLVTKRLVDGTPFVTVFATPMCERFEKLETLRKAAWESISGRREFEWHVSIAFWTLLGAFIAGFGIGRVAEIHDSERWFLWIFPFSLGLAHSLWLCGLDRAYKIDKREEEAFRRAMRQDADVLFAEPKEDTDRRDKAKRSQWNLRSQQITTWALTFLAMYVVFRAQVPPDQQP